MQLTQLFLSDTATGALLGQVDCASEVTGIQFNNQLKQVATSHHSVVQDEVGTPVNTNNAVKCILNLISTISKL